jgi:hypothetical protein
MMELSALNYKKGRGVCLLGFFWLFMALVRLISKEQSPLAGKASKKPEKSAKRKPPASCFFWVLHEGRRCGIITFRRIDEKFSFYATIGGTFVLLDH